MGPPPADLGPGLAGRRRLFLLTGTREGDEPGLPAPCILHWRNAGESHRSQRTEGTSTRSLLSPNACPTGRGSGYLAVTVKSSNSTPPPPAMP